MALDEATFVELFGEPVASASPDEPWAYAFSTYRKSVSGYDLEFSVLPASGEFRLSIGRNGAEFLSVKSHHQTNIEAEIWNDKGFLILHESPAHRTIIRVKPDFYFAQELGEAF